MSIHTSTVEVLQINSILHKIVEGEMKGWSMKC